MGPRSSGVQASAWVAVAVALLGASVGCRSGAGQQGVSASSAQPPAVPSPSPPASSQQTVPPVPHRPIWRELADIGTPRDDFADAVVGDRIWVMGGMTGERGNRLTTTEIYDTSTDRWRYGPAVPEALASFEGVSVGPRIYVFGGFDRDSQRSDYAAMLDTRTGRWQELPPLPHERYAHTVTALGDKIYVLGGDGVEGPVRQIDVFDTRTDSWSDGGTMARARGSHDAVAVGDDIYVLGGWLRDAPTDLVQVFDPQRRSWREVTPMPEPMSRGGAAVVDRSIYVSYHEFSAVYDVPAGTWSPANPMTLSRHGMGYLPVGDKIYGIAGCSESPLADVDIVDVLDTASRQ